MTTKEAQQNFSFIGKGSNKQAYRLKFMSAKEINKHANIKRSDKKSLEDMQMIRVECHEEGSDNLCYSIYQNVLDKLIEICRCIQIHPCFNLKG